VTSRSNEAAAFELPEASRAPGGDGDSPERIDAEASVARLKAAAAAGDPPAQMILALLSGCAEHLKTAFDSAIGAGAAEASALYAAAAAALDAGRADTAVGLLAALLLDDARAPDALLGLAVCAARLDRLDAASLFAEAAIARGSKHPRAFCLAGLGALDQGDKAAGRHRLALAARLARRDPKFQSDLRAAQRLLLMLHFE
jgi:hypothetical protein